MLILVRLLLRRLKSSKSSSPGCYFLSIELMGFVYSGVEEGSLVLKHDFVLVEESVTMELRDRNAMEAMKKLGRKVKLLDHLPVPDVD